jgi:hypothetical protein
MIERRLVSRDISVGCGGDPGPGDIVFYQAILPPLASGLYQLVSSEVVTLTSETPAYAATNAFQIDGPRFRLQATDVQQVYPPANLTGNYAQSLPHVVFRLPSRSHCSRSIRRISSPRTEARSPSPR